MYFPRGKTSSSSIKQDLGKMYISNIKE
ncbi:MAG: glycerol-3-phosphate cytidylyltransferase, partial [Lactococcus sp.]